MNSSTDPNSTKFVLSGQRQQLQTVNSIHLSYLQWPNDGQPVLLLHGMADQGLVWANLAQFLAPTYHCVAPDLRGHGDSSKPDHGYHCSDLIQDLECLVAYLNWPTFHLIAHSWSAKIATVWARQNPDRLLSLTLVDPFFINRLPGILRLSFPILYRTLPFLKTIGPFPSFEEVEAVARELKQYRGWGSHQQALFQASVAEKEKGAWGSKFTRQARNEIFEDVMQVAGLTEVLNTPTLLTIPEQGLNRFAWQLAPYRQYLLNLSIQAVPGNHWPFLVAPQDFHQEIAQFLEQQSKCSHGTKEAL